jgi:hypothetical protein
VQAGAAPQLRADLPGTMDYEPMTRAKALEYGEEALRQNTAVLRHVSTCPSTECALEACQREKLNFTHILSCQTPGNFTGQCAVCTKMWVMMHSHSFFCDDTACPVPYCLELRRQRAEEHRLR